MAQDDTYDYLYIVQWDNSDHRSSYTVHHGIKLNPGVDRADFEQFMKEKGLSPVGSVSTRAGEIVAQYLLTDVTGSPPGRFEDLDLNLESFGKRTSIKKFVISCSWSKAEGVSGSK